MQIFEREIYFLIIICENIADDVLNNVMKEK
jgi:hypothetical protein